MGVDIVSVKGGEVDGFDRFRRKGMSRYGGEVSYWWWI